MKTKEYNYYIDEVGVSLLSEGVKCVITPRPTTKSDSSVRLTITPPEKTATITESEFNKIADCQSKGFSLTVLRNEIFGE